MNVGSGSPAKASLPSVEWLQGQRLCFLGKLGSLAKRDAKSWVVEQGAVVVPLTDPRVQIVVLGADSFPFNLRELDDLTLDKIQSQQIVLWEETEFWEKCGLLEHSQDKAPLYTPAMLADLLKVPIQTIRRWHRLGLLHAVKEIHRLPYFDFQEVAAARRLAKWLQTSSPDQVEKKLVQLARVLPGTQRPLSQLPVIVQGNEVLVRQISGLVDPNGQLRFDFDLWGDNDSDDSHPVYPLDQPNEPRRETLELTDADKRPWTAPAESDHSERFQDALTSWSNGADSREISPEEFLQAANRCEDEQDWDGALQIYRAMLMAFGPSADLCFQIGELLYRAGDLTAARERYSMAVELDTQFVEARANLGCVLMDLQQWDLALASFEGALDLHPEYADALFHAAAVCEKIDQETRAQDYWQRFLDVAPNSPWAQYAEARLPQDQRVSASESNSDPSPTSTS